MITKKDPSDKYLEKTTRPQMPTKRIKRHMITKMHSQKVTEFPSIIITRCHANSQSTITVLQKRSSDKWSQKRTWHQMVTASVPATSGHRKGPSDNITIATPHNGMISRCAPDSASFCTESREKKKVPPDKGTTAEPTYRSISGPVSSWRVPPGLYATRYWAELRRKDGPTKIQTPRHREA